MGLCDLHCHLLPLIDDGYVSKESFSRMLHLYLENGITTIAFTPTPLPGYHPAYRIDMVSASVRLPDVPPERNGKVYAPL